ncbi:MAG: transcription termination factor NusA [Pirellulales bacterium]
MNPAEILRIVDAIHRDKNIDKEIVFVAIESALVSAMKKHYSETDEVDVKIDRESGEMQGFHNGEPLDADIVGRVGAQTAKQVIIQKIREAERDALYDEYEATIGDMITGVIHRYEGGVATVQLTNVEAILPRSEQIPGETHHPNERVRATVFEVRKQGSRVKVVLSRTRPQFVQRLFEQEIPEIAEGVIEIKAMAREPGYRSKVAVSSSDQRVDCVGACVGVRGNRIKNIVDELAGERIDIVRWNDDLKVLIGNALQPAEVEDVIFCQMLGRAIVLVREDQLSLAIGRRGQNVRLASKLCGWDIEIMTREELDEQIDRAVGGFSQLEGVDEALALKLVEEGYMSYDDLSVIEPVDLAAMGSLTEEQVDKIVEQAEERALEAEQIEADQRRRQRELDRIEKATAEAHRLEAERDAARQAAAEAANPEASNPETASSESATVESADEASPTPAADVAAEEGAADDGAVGEGEEAATEDVAEEPEKAPVASDSASDGAPDVAAKESSD